MSDFAGFTPDLFQFYAELESNNEKAWWEANKQRYEDVVRGPALDFIAAFAEPLAEFSPHFVAVPKKVGGSLMRPHKDTRFSKDKTPYKTNVGIQFRHARGKDVHAPGLYLHLSTEEIFLGAGIYHPDREPLAAVRARIDREPESWVAVRDAPSFTEVWRLGGSSLKLAPKGYPKDHPLIDDIKRKDFIAVADLDVPDVLGPEAVDHLAGLFQRTRPFVGFVCEAMGVEF